VIASETSKESFEDGNAAAGTLESFANFIDNLSNRGIIITPRSFYLQPKESIFVRSFFFKY